MLGPEVGVQVVLLSRGVSDELGDAEGLGGLEGGAHKGACAAQDAGYEGEVGFEGCGLGGAACDFVEAGGARYEGVFEVGFAVKWSVSGCGIHKGGKRGEKEGL